MYREIIRGKCNSGRERNYSVPARILTLLSHPQERKHKIVITCIKLMEYGCSKHRARVKGMLVACRSTSAYFSRTGMFRN